MAGTATGIVNLFPFAGGAVFQPVLGYVLEHYGRVNGNFTLAGYHTAFLVLFGSGLIGLSAFARRKINSHWTTTVISGSLGAVFSWGN